MPQLKNDGTSAFFRSGNESHRGKPRGDRHFRAPRAAPPCHPPGSCAPHPWSARLLVRIAAPAFSVGSGAGAARGAALRPQPLCGLPRAAAGLRCERSDGAPRPRCAARVRGGRRPPGRGGRVTSAVHAAALLRRLLRAGASRPPRTRPGVAACHAPACSSVAARIRRGLVLPPRSRVATLRFHARFQSHPVSPRAVPSQQAQGSLRGQPPGEQAHARDTFAVPDSDTDAQLCGARAGSPRPGPLC